MSASPRLRHIAAWIETPGGMGAIIRRHREREPDSAFIGLFDRPAGRGPGATRYLGGRAWTTPASLRRRFQAAVPTPADVAVYHNAWGTAWFSGLDRARRRVVMLHTDRPDFEPFVQAQRGLIDGVICLSTAMAETCRRLLPEMTADRTVVLPCPIATPPMRRDRPETDGPVRLGYAGRLERHQKRLDRAGQFLRELDSLGVDWRFEFLGDGEMRTALHREFADERRVILSGWKTGWEYWEALARWDAIVFFSDYEASPLSLLEAMALGVLPVFPGLGRTLGDEYARQIDPRCLYPAGDPLAAARQVRALLAEPADVRARLRARAMALTEPHQSGRYDAGFQAGMAAIAGLPRLSPDAGIRPHRLADVVPIGLLARYHPDALFR